jgi:hypothetical protein
MADRVLPGKPQLTDFVGGHGGPPAIEYRGGAVKVIAALIYSDGVLIAWLVGSMPDLSWMPDEEPNAERTAFLDRFQDQPHMIERLRRSKRLSTFWDSATLSDDLGSNYLWASGDSESRDGSVYRGRETFSPAPPEGVRELTVRAHDLAITISLDKGPPGRT